MNVVNVFVKNVILKSCHNRFTFVFSFAVSQTCQKVKLLLFKFEYSCVGLTIHQSKSTDKEIMWHFCLNNDFFNRKIVNTNITKILLLITCS